MHDHCCLSDVYRLTSGHLQFKQMILPHLETLVAMIIMAQTHINILDRCEKHLSCTNFGNHEQNHNFFKRHDFLVAPLFTLSVLALQEYLFNNLFTKTQSYVSNFGK